MPKDIIDAANIGQDKAIQNPQDAIRAASGVYEDAALKVAEDDRFPTKQLPQVNCPVPFTLTGGSTTGQRE